MTETPPPYNLKHIAHLIPELNPNAQILQLLSRDILQVHKVRDQCPHNASYAQKLDLGWVVVGEVCLAGADKPKGVNAYRSNVHFSLCPNHLVLKEKFTVDTSNKPLSSQKLGHSCLSDRPVQNTREHSLGSTILGMLQI